MTDHTNKSKKTILADIPSKEMLGIYARYHGWAYQLLSQCMNIKIKSNSMKKAPTKQKYGSIMLTYLKGMAHKSYVESQTEDPSFTSVIFHHERKLLKQERLGAIRYDQGNLSFAKQTLLYLLQHDKSLQIQEKPHLVEEDNLDQAITQTKLLPDSLGDTETENENTQSVLKPFQVYSQENVISCLNGLSLCQALFSEKSRHTTANDKIAEFRQNHGPIYADAIGGALSTITGNQRGFISMDLLHGYCDDLYRISAKRPDENCSPISIHPV
jgi:hypothetical protein